MNNEIDTMQDTATSVGANSQNAASVDGSHEEQPHAGALALAPGSAPSAAEIAETRSALGPKAKLRRGIKMTIDTKAMKCRSWPIIEVWVKAKRQYMPLCVGEVWRYETVEARDAVLSALQNNKFSNAVNGPQRQDGAA